MNIGISWVDEDGAILDSEIEAESVEKLRLLNTLFMEIDLDTIIRSDRGQLALAVLRNKLESAPLAMLVDDIQTSDEYAQQQKHHPKYTDLYQLLFRIGQSVYGKGITQGVSIVTQIGRLLAPCHTCSGTASVNTKVAGVHIPCCDCDNGVHKGFFFGSTPKVHTITREDLYT